jgi:PAS domain S-box-containing protein
MGNKPQTKTYIHYLEERIQYLEEVNRFTLDTLEMAASLGDFQTNINKLQEPSLILRETRSRIKRLISAEALGFFLVNESDNDFYLADWGPRDCSVTLKREVEFLIENGTFAWTLRERRPVIESSQHYEKQVILHAMATRSRIRGMFVAILKENQTNIPDTALSLLSIILLNSSNALESFELYQMIREITDNLEKKENYRMLFEAAPDGVEVLDARGNVIDCNKTHQHLLSYSRDEIVGNHTTSFFKEKKASFEQKLQHLKLTGYAEGEVELLNRNGLPIPVWRKEKAIYDDSMTFVGSVVYNRDISEPKRAALACSQIS